MTYQEQLKNIELASNGFPPNNISLSQRIFSDLVLAKKWKDVQFEANQGLQTCIFLAREPEKTCNQLFIIPVLQDEANLSMDNIAYMFDSIKTPVEKLTLAIYSSDSAIVYYHISKGLVKATQH
ncbi:Sen15 protein-domain-containing protein, partial [Parasitella parasitica]